MTNSQGRLFLFGGIGALLSLNAVIRWIPQLRFYIWTFTGGIVVAFVILGWLCFTRVRPLPTAFDNLGRLRLKFSNLETFEQERKFLESRTVLERQPLYPPNLLVSDTLDALIGLIIRDFVLSWSKHITSDPTFGNNVELSIRHVADNLRERLSSLDIVDVVVARIVPILTAHLADFSAAEKAVKGKNLNKILTDSEELELAIAKKYRNGRLHPAASLTFSDTQMAQKDHLRKIAGEILPLVAPKADTGSGLVCVLLREIISCAVLFPVVKAIADPDTMNQIIEALGRSLIQDRKNVEKLRAALDQHATPESGRGVKYKKQYAFVRLQPKDDERSYEKFIRAINLCNNLSDARRMRSEISSQLKRDEGLAETDPTYIKRLETGRKLLDQRVALLTSTITPASFGKQSSHRPSVNGRRASRRHQTSQVVDILREPTALSYFMEHMDRQRRLSLVQFWLVVDGMRDPLDDGDESGISMWTPSERNDIAQIYEAYLSVPELNISDKTKLEVKAFLNAGGSASIHLYKRARGAVLRAQSEVLDEMQTRDLPEFKRSDLFYKYLASDDLAGPDDSVDDAQYDSMSRSASWAVPGSIDNNEDLYSSRHSFDGERPSNVLDEGWDYDPLSRSPNLFEGHRPSTPDKGVVLAMEAALNEIVDDKRDLDPLHGTDFQDSPRSSLDFAFEPRNAMVVDGKLMSQPIRKNTGKSSTKQDASEIPAKKVPAAQRHEENVTNNTLQRKSMKSATRAELFGENEQDLFSESSALSETTVSDGGKPQENPARGQHAVTSNPLLSEDDGLKEVDKDNLLSLPNATVQTQKKSAPSISSLGLVSTTRNGVFDNELFPDEAAAKFEGLDEDDSELIADDKDAEIHLAGPGDLGLSEAIAALSYDIEKLTTQEAVVDSLMKKAELTNNAVELRILRKSKASLEREIRRKELQRQQYIIQESDNSLYGRANIRIKSSVIESENGRDYALYVIEVRRPIGGIFPAAEWVVARRYSEFFQLHQELKAKFPAVSNLDFPRRRVVIKLHRDFIEKRRIALERYLQQLLLIEEVCSSREFRAFLSQSSIVTPPGLSVDTQQLTPDLIKRLYSTISDGMEDMLGSLPSLDQFNVGTPSSLTPPALATGAAPLLTANLTETQAELNEYEDSKSRYPLVKPICDLFLELFSLAPTSTSTSSWIRGRAVVVVLHQLLGGAIERKLREQAKTIFDEEAIQKYLNLAKDIMWPDGKRRELTPRTAKEKAQCKQTAKETLQRLFPDIVGQVVGRSNSKEAARKVWAAVNITRLNYSLFYEIVDEVVAAVFDVRIDYDDNSL